MKNTIEEFNKLYTGFILIAEPTHEAGEQDYKQKRRAEIVENLRFPFVITGFIMIAIFLLFRSFSLGMYSLQIALLAFAKSAGLIVSILLLIQSIDSSNLLVQRFCMDGKRISCDTILSSKAAKITEELSWSEVGFFSFAGTWLALFFSSASIGMLQALALINLISLPYTFYSIYYQYQVAKYWCILCCTIQALLWLEFIAFKSFWAQPIQVPSVYEIILLLICLLIPVLFWVFIKPYLLKAQQFANIKRQFRAFKYNTNFFQRALTEQMNYTAPDAAYSIVIGNKDAKQIITVVTNPYCSPCSKAHQTLDEWVSKRSDIQLRIIFSTYGNQSEPKITAQHLMLLNEINQDLAIEAMRNWYSQEQKNYDSWKRTYPVSKEQLDSITLEKQREWCDMINVAFTPTILVNGYRLPRHYSVEDIKYLI